MTRDSDVPGAADGARATSDPDARREAGRRADRVALNRGMDQGMSVLSYLIAGVAMWGGLGWLGDHLLHTSFLLPIGIVLGAALGVYLIIKRFGDLGGGSSAPVETSVPQNSGKEKVWER